MIYFISLQFGLPIWVVLLLVSASVFALWKIRPPHADLQSPTTKSSLWATVILVVGLTLIVHKAYDLVEKNGHWDAWWFWNVRANYLARPQYWRLAFSGTQYGTMFTVPVAHSDYPPFLPLLNGLCWRVMNTQPAVVPFVWSMLSLLLIPSILFLELFARNRLVAAATLFFLTTQDHWIQVGTSQIADYWIGLFLLLALVSYNSFRTNRNARSVFWTGTMLGCCLWTKNEGMIISAVFVLFTIPDLIRNKVVGKLLLGLSIPVLALIIFKLTIAPANDIIVAQNHFPWEKIRDLSRYTDVRQLTWRAIELDFPAIPYLIVGYFIFCLIQRRKPDWSFWAIISIFIAYLSIYIVTPHNIGWHVSTSVARLIIQLIPGMLWVIGMRLSLAKVKYPTQPQSLD